MAKIGILERCWLGWLLIRMGVRVLHGFDGGGDGVDYLGGSRLLLAPWVEDLGESVQIRRWGDSRGDGDGPME